jgi:hypothetical protein
MCPDKKRLLGNHKAKRPDSHPYGESPAKPIHKKGHVSFLTIAAFNLKNVIVLTYVLWYSMVHISIHIAMIQCKREVLFDHGI